MNAMEDSLRRPAYLHDREREWEDLSEFATDPRVGATLAVVYGRRRQGKTFLLQSLVEAAGGLLFGGLQLSEAQNLDRCAEAYGQWRRLSPGTVRFPTWDAALDAVFAAGEDSDKPVVAVLDELPYLLESAPALPSVIQSALSPRGRARTRSRTRLVLCGSALSTMQGLLSGGAPLRGRASRELVIHPFGYRDAARFWDLAAPGELDTAFRINALVGGTPAYLEMSGGPPSSPRTFDRWVTRGLLGPGSAMFREGNVLLHAEVSDPTPYHSVLAAVAVGAHRRSEIGGILRRPDSALSHPLTVLEHTQLIERLPDALQPRRAVYHIAEPAIRLHQLVIRRNEAALVAGHAAAVWASVADTVAARIYGPHLEFLARQWCLLHACADTLGGRANQVRPATIACREHRQGHKIDAVVVSAPAFEAERVLAIGEANAGTKPVDVAELARLDHLRQLLPANRVAGPPRLLLFGRAGFTARLQDAAGARSDVELVDLRRLYQGS
jgi:AAA+ ATPase superfamily predicted ATPase